MNNVDPAAVLAWLRSEECDVVTHDLTLATLAYQRHVLAEACRAIAVDPPSGAPGVAYRALREAGMEVDDG